MLGSLPELGVKNNNKYVLFVYYKKLCNKINIVVKSIKRSHLNHIKPVKKNKNNGRKLAVKQY